MLLLASSKVYKTLSNQTAQDYLSAKTQADSKESTNCPFTYQRCSPSPLPNFLRLSKSADHSDCYRWGLHVSYDLQSYICEQFPALVMPGYFFRMLLWLLPSVILRYLFMASLSTHSEVRHLEKRRLPWILTKVIASWRLMWAAMRTSPFLDFCHEARRLCFQPETRFL